MAIGNFRHLFDLQECQFIVFIEQQQDYGLVAARQKDVWLF
jgi:hypothetical protein